MAVRCSKCKKQFPDPMNHSGACECGGTAERYSPTWEEAQRRRADYMAKKTSHADYYLWLADTIHISSHLIPATREAIQHALARGDEHLNTIPLRQWDALDPTVRRMAGRAGMAVWSLCETVCVLKAYATRWAAQP